MQTVVFLQEVVKGPGVQKRAQLAIFAQGMTVATHLLDDGRVGVTDGIRTRNIQNHNLGLYH